MKYQMALSLFALLASGGCGGGGVMSPASRESRLSASGVPASSNESIARSGDLHFTKECSEFHRRAGEWCTITSSNLKEIPVGTRVYYLSDASLAGADTDVILDPPGPGNNTASGHVVLSFTTLTGQVTLDGGTGKFKGIHASAAVTHLTGVNWAWDGTYSYNPPNGK